MIYKDINHWREGSPPKKSIYIITYQNGESNAAFLQSVWRRRIPAESGNREPIIHHDAIIHPTHPSRMKNTWVLNRMEMLFNLYCYGYKAYTMQCSLKVYNCWYKCLRDDRCKRRKSWWLLLSVVAVDRDALSIDDMEKRKRDKEGPDSMISLAVSCDATGDLIISIWFMISPLRFSDNVRDTQFVYVCARISKWYIGYTRATECPVYWTAVQLGSWPTSRSPLKVH